MAGMDEQTKKIVLSLLRMHIGLTAHVRAQGIVLEDLAERLALLERKPFDLDHFQVWMAQATTQCQQALPQTDRQLAQLLASLAPAKVD